MQLATGTHLGPYQILALVGAGGMGEVYRARDTRLDRTVAVKVLPDHLASKPEFRQRFEREARLISSLSHANICSLYDVGHQNGIEYLVMEFLEGETLARRLERGPVPIEQLIRYATQISDALDKAHRQGVVHRDLKPANIMITRSGVKLLDFGLAKPRSDAGLTSSNSSLPTSPLDITAEGTIIGTFQYMAPEQLEGKEADARSDIFAFGSTMYEMATGKKAFSGDSRASLIAAILHKNPPPISSVEPLTPLALDRVIRTCLEKDPDDRWQTAHDLTVQFRWIAESSLSTLTEIAASPRRRLHERLAWAVAAVALLAAAILGLVGFLRSNEPRPVVRFSVPPPESAIFYYDAIFDLVAISPDGRRLAFTAAADGRRMLWIRSLESSIPKPVPGTEGATSPFWSPDSRYVAFFAQSSLKRVDVNGGLVQVICNTSASAAT
ncbi:MAG TPA: protein kinase, partial [Blastocatellia bacterium]|nr:protein kinase [Blastocatellia bacterium]